MAIADLVAKIIVPIAILVAGSWLTEQQKQGEIEDQMFKTSFDSVSKLASQNPKERLFVVKVLNNYAKVKTLPREIPPVLIYIAQNDQDREVAQEAAQAAKSFIEANRESTVKSKPGAKTVPKDELDGIETNLKNIPTIIYIHVLYKSQAQYDAAQQIVNKLRDQNYSVPEIRWVDNAPTKTQLRYFHRDDEKDVKNNVIPNLDKLGLKAVTSEYMPGYEKSIPIKKQYELWYGKPASK